MFPLRDKRRRVAGAQGVHKKTKIVLFFREISVIFFFSGDLQGRRETLIFYQDGILRTFFYGGR